MRPARTADNSAVLIVSNVKVRVETQILHDLLNKALPFPFRLSLF
jgi:hypothetical protein